MKGRRLGHYQILEKLGAGGMGEVYRAEDTRLGREVAIKLLPEAFSDDPDRLSRLEREAKLLATLNHPHIAQIHALEKVDGSRALVMELVDGETLRERIARGPIPVDDAVRLAIEIAQALEAAHERGIIHRDLKPSNIKLTLDGEVKVLDFGLAKPIGGIVSAGTSDLQTLTYAATEAGLVVGTLAYMSPEQARAEALDRRTDIWAFGVVLWEMLTGQRLFKGETASDVLAAVLRAEPEWESLPAETPFILQRLLRHCLTRNLKDRLHDIGDARIDLQSISADAHLREESAVAVPSRKGWSNWLGWGLAAVLALVVIVIAISGFLSDDATEPSRDIVRFTMDLPPGTVLTNVVSRDDWKQPSRNELALSPDGRTLVFSAMAEGDRSTMRLYRRNMDQAEAEAIAGTEGATNPFFSPDGTWVAFWAEGELRKVSLDGGLPIPLAEYSDATSPTSPPMGGSWGPDETIYIGTHLEGLQRVAAESGRLEPLTVPDRAKEYAHRLPQVLPGGKAVLFTVAYGWSGAGGRIEAVILDTGERKVVVDSGLDGRFVPSGHLLFLHHGTLMAAPFDVDRLERTGRPVPVVEGVVHATNLPGGYWNSGSGLLAVSDNGSLVFAPGGMRPDPQRHFMWVGRDGVVEPLLDLPKGPLAQPRLSPDGRWLAFYIRGLDSSLWVHDLHRGTNTRLTQEGRIDRLVWTPDSQRIVFGWTLGGVANLHWISRQGNEPVDRLSTSEFVQQPSSCSPDGRYLAYVHWPLPQGPEIRLLDLKSGVSEPFLQGEHSYGFPDFSPNGRWLAYTSGESGRSEVWITSFPDRDQRVQVSNSGGVAPAWSGEGREIYYLSEHTNGDLMVVQATGDMTLTLGNPRTLIEGPLSTGVPVRTYDVGGDSRRFLFSRTALPAPSAPPVRQLQVVLNWFEELERLVPTE